MTTAEEIATYRHGWEGLVTGCVGDEERDLASRDLELKRTPPAWARAWKSRSGNRIARITIALGGFPAAGAREEFAGGWASILDGPGRAVAARVTDRL
jgi:hypothetical protein